MSETLRIRNGVLHDPANDVDGERRDLCVRDGRIVDSLPEDAPSIDVQGAYVLPGGVDVHCHIAGPKLGHGRCLQPEKGRADPVLAPRFADGAIGRSGSGGIVPSTYVTGYRYAGLGYTTAMEAAVPPSGARHTHEELEATPVIDRGFYVLAGNHKYVLEGLARGEDERVKDFLGWMVRRTGAYALKLVNAGGVESWKRARTTPEDVHSEVEGSGVSAARITSALAAAAEELELPHPVHVHCTNLGQPGNVRTTLETLKAVEGRRIHLAHVQFHSYEGDPNGRPTSGARRIAEYLNEHPTVSADVGQVMFGDATGMTADGRLGYFLHRLTGNRWINVDTELETGCGVVPYAYRPASYVHALQWTVGLELFLLASDPWRLVLSTDHPNGGSFLAYPRLMRLLMDRDFRRQQLAGVNEEVAEGSALRDGLAREYTLNEIAIVTRAAPARLLGLDRKGHLGVGADADVAVYDPADDWEEVFRVPRLVLKGGRVVVRDGEPVAGVFGRTLRARPAFDDAVEPSVRDFFRERMSLRYENWGMTDEEMSDPDRFAEPAAAGGGS